MPAKPLLRPRRVQTQTHTQTWDNVSDIIGGERAPFPNSSADAAAPAPVKKITPWELYNDKAKLYDREMLKEWEENLSILLVFAALFSAVLTAFIISSMDLLQVDTKETMRDILLTISRQLSNSSTLAYQPVDFTPPTWSIHVNFLFFASLGCSLVAALASVLALQWIRDYDIGLARITIPRERALRRHFRFEGVQLWWMPEIIAVLPTLLHVALLLFLGGLVDWLIHIHLTVSVAMIIALCVSAIFYIVTQACAAIWPSAPFRTPISRFLEVNGVVLYVKLYLPVKRLWRNVSRRWIQPTNSQEPEEAAIPYLVATAPRFREENAIKRDHLLPSSALSWLLGHVERSAQSKPDIGEIFRVLTVEDGISAISQPNLKGKAEWSGVIDWYIAELLQAQQSDFTYPTETEWEFIFCSQMATIIGNGSLLWTAQGVLKSSPFYWPSMQTTALGLSVRLALWKNHCPFPIDAADPPLNLFKEIFQNGSPLTVGVLVIVLRDMETFMADGRISGADFLSCLTTLMHTSQDAQLRFNFPFYMPQLRLAIYTGAINALSGMCGLVVPANMPKTDLDGITYIFDMYNHPGRKVSWPAEAEDFYRALVDVLIGLIMPFTRPLGMTQPLQMTRSMIPLLSHPTVHLVWDGRGNVTSRKLVSPIFDLLSPHYEITIPPEDVLGSRLPAVMAGVALRMCQPLGFPFVPGTVEWKILQESLEMVAGVCSNGSVERAHIHRVPLAINDPFPWIYSTLSSFDVEMFDDGFSVTISLFLSIGIRAYLGRTLHCPAAPDRLEQLATLRSPILALAGCVLMGWGYEQFIPPDDDSMWNTLGWRLMLLGLLVNYPITRSTSEMALFLAISRRKSRYYNELLLDAVERRTPVEPYAGDPATQAELAQGMQAALPALINLPHIPNHRFEPIVDKWRALPTFFNDFVAAGGLEWILTRIHMYSTHGRRFTNPDGSYSPLDGIILDQLDAHNGIKSLSAQNCERLLRSPIVCDLLNDSNTYPGFLAVITACFRRLEGFGPTPVFKEASSVCAMILNHTVVERACYRMEAPQMQYLGRVRFKEWFRETRKLIADLRAEKPDESIEDDDESDKLMEVEASVEVIE